MRKKKKNKRDKKRVYIRGVCCRFWSRDDARDKCAAGVATEDVGEEVTIGENMEDGTAGKLSENSQVGVTAESDDLGVYL